MSDEIREWRTQSVKHKVALVLIIDGISFSYTEEEGIVFEPPKSYVERMKERLVTCYGCSVMPVIAERKVNLNK